jgi:hypothetical protein
MRRRRDGHYIIPKRLRITNAWSIKVHDPNEPLYGLNPEIGSASVRPVNIPAQKAYKGVRGEQEHFGTGTERR